MLSTKSRRTAHAASAPSSALSPLAPRALLASALALLLACSSGSNGSGNGGNTGNGGSSGSGGSGNGGSANGGSGGSNNGGTAAGGSGAGGKGNGGSANGGSGSGGSNAGGSAKGGSGGSGNGGAAGSGGSGNGGAAGSGNGGAAGSGGGSGNGGATGNGGGSGNGGATGNGGGSGGGASGNAPAGWWKLSDWNVSSPDWHGCVMPAFDNGTVTSGTSITPQDFTAGVTGGSYHVKGTVGADPQYESVAMLQFDIADPISGDAKQCAYKTPDPNAVGPAGVAMPSSATGIAINWAQGVGSQFRIQLNGPNGSKQGTAGASERWCATIKDAGGPSFVKFTDFYQSCWFVGQTGKDPGKQYAGEPIDAIVFLVPGTTTAQPFDFTINGFAPGTSAKDAPGATSTTCTPVTGTLGGAGSTDLDYQRVKVKGADCGTYIVQNNNWGSPGGSDQTLSYSGNSFKVTASSGTGSSAPASFPSIFQGRNGQVQNGAFSTEGTDNMPIQVSKISSVQTEFAWSGGGGGKDFNAAYDVWFAASPPAAGSYNDAISGFVMVWLYDPPNHSPIGGSPKRTATIAGHSWDVWVGPRGGSGANSGAPVVSYVAKDSPLASLSFDMNLFIKDAAADGIQSSWYLTDVFAGFEIWNGGDGVGLQATKVTIAVK